MPIINNDLFNGDNIKYQILQCMNFIKTYTGNIFPFIINSNNNTPPDTFHDDSINQNYLPKGVTTTDSLLLFAKGCFAAYKATNNFDYWLLTTSIALGFLDNAFPLFSIPPANPNIPPYWFFHWIYLNNGTLVTKGSQNFTSPYNYGYFKSINFVNGVGNLDDSLADVYKVYSGSLLFKHVHSLVIPGSGADYQITSWVSQGYLVNAVTGAKILTHLPNGQITLVQPYNGVLGVTYSLYDGQTVYGRVSTNHQNQALIDVNPVWYSADPITQKGIYTNTTWESIWHAYDLCLSIFTQGNDPFWENAAIALKLIAIDHVNINNQTYYFKKEDSTDPFRYPGSSVVGDPTLYSITRELINTTFINFLKAVVSAIPSGKEVILRNIIPQVDMTETVHFLCEFGADTPGIYFVRLSTSFNIYDISHRYTATILVNNPNQSQIEYFKPSDFYQWDGTTSWTVSNGVSLKSNLNQQFVLTLRLLKVIVFNNYCIATFIIAQNGSDVANFTLNNCNFTYDPPDIVYNLSGTFDIVITDALDNVWRTSLPDTNNIWVKLKLSWSQFGNTSPAQSNIKSIQFESTGIDQNILGIYYLGDVPPTTLPVTSVVYKAEIITNLKVNHTIWLGDFKVYGNDLDTIKYTPGVVPFGITSINGQPTKFLQSSSFYSGQQSPYHWHIWGLFEYKQNVLNFLSDAQDQYRTATGFSAGGLLAPVFINSYWDSGEVGQFSKITTGKFSNIIGYPIPFFFTKKGYKPATVYDINIFVWNGFNGNLSDASHLFRSIEQTARVLYIDPTNPGVKKIVLNFLNTTSYYYYLQGNNKPITDVPARGQPQTNYDNPAVAAINGKIAIYANLAGIDPNLTCKIIKNSYDYINSLWINSGSMMGTWSANQKTFTVGGTVYNQYFSFWIGEILDFYSMLLQYERSIIYPYVEPYGILPSLPVSRIENIKLADYPIQILQFTDGNQQRVSVSMNNCQVGSTMTVVYENLNSYQVRVFSDFYNSIGGLGGSFTLPPEIWQFDNMREGIWKLNEVSKVETKISSSKYGRFKLSIIMEREN